MGRQALKKRFVPAIAAFALALTQPAFADPAYPDFTFKRVTPPSAGAAKRITVQIAPKPPPAEPESPEADKKPVPPPSPVGRFAWFWDGVSPRLEESRPGRLTDILTHLAAPPAGAAAPAPRLELLMEIARRHGAEILMTTAGKPVSPALVLAMIAVESSGRADAVSSAGAQGLMQLMPATALRFGVEDSADTAQNIRGGVAFLDLLMHRFDGDAVMVLAGYNAGEGAVTDHAGVPPYAETRDYVPKVLAAFEVARGLCRPRPSDVTDGCVFDVPG